jgi:hypothetical protein
VDDGLLLFPMTALLWFASQPEMRTKPGIRELVDYFCEDMADRLRSGSSLTGRPARPGRDTAVYRLSKAIMNGDYAWLEEGILACLKPDETGQTANRPIEPDPPR